MPVEVPFGDDGSGDAVLLLHGTTGSRNHWLQVTPTLATRWRVLAPDFVDPGHRLDIADRLAAITAPTLIVHGRHDQVVPIAHGRALAGAIKDAELVELDFRHGLTTEGAAELVPLLTSWFERH